MEKHTSTYLRVLAIATLLMAGAEEARSDYGDVAVVVNLNSSQSRIIGEYFRAARAIPPVNMVYVTADTVEEIDSVRFALLRAQIEQHFVTHNLTASINYIVTTKGVPLKVNRGNTFATNSPSSSVESELMLILGTYASYINGYGRVNSPYYYASASFSRSAYGIYLVTRLDGYTVEHVLALIDRSGPSRSVSVSASFVLDQDPAWNNTLPYLNTNMVSAASTLQSRGKAVELNSDTLYVTSRQNVVGYVSWGTNDHYDQHSSSYAIPAFSWAPGSIAETYVSTSGRSFQSPPVYGQSLIADLIAEGVCGAKGYVYEPFSSSMADVSILFDRYSSGFNLAESFFMASRYISWMDVVVGDPKTSIDGPSAPLPVELSSFAATEHPSSVDFSWTTLSETQNYGFILQVRPEGDAGYCDVSGSFVPGAGTTTEPHTYRWTHSNVSTGTYHYRLKQMDLDGTIHFSEGVRVTVNGSPTGIADAGLPVVTRLRQNYPNPFNPSTTISFDLHESAQIELSVYSVDGRLVSTVVDGQYAAGVHRIPFDARRAGLASGSYLLVLKSGQGISTSKMLYIQ